MSAIIPPYRSAANLDAAIAEVDVEHTIDLQPDWWPEPPGSKLGVTWCNKAFARWAKRMGVYVPEGMLANDMKLWFDSAEARSKGWYECTEAKAIQRAAVGFPVAAVWFNPAAPPHNHGHIAAGVGQQPPGEVQLWVMAAGATNHSHIRRSGTFGPHVPSFFTCS